MFTELFPILSTPDLPRALGFYRDLLGLRVTYQFPGEGEPVYVGLRLGASQLGIGGEPNAPAASDRHVLCVYAEDCDTAVSLLRESGVPVLVEPATEAWGERSAYVADPDGNRVLILSPIPSEGVRADQPL
jgi:lactoylglutathione lyase